jgi:hypothetical protein
MERKESWHRGGADRHYFQSAFVGLKPIFFVLSKL